MWNKLRKKLDLPESYISITLGFLVVLVAGVLTYNYFVKNKIQLKPGESAQKQEQMATGEMAVGELPTTYTVSSGDTLWSIAEKAYKSGYNWVTIAQANNLSNPNYLEVGEKLDLPKAEAISPPGEISAAQAAPPKEYTVAKGDNLWNIAEREYGSGYKWTEIAQFNNLTDPDLIHAGNVLRLPQ